MGLVYIITSIQYLKTRSEYNTSTERDRICVCMCACACDWGEDKIYPAND
jgi:hypothetical protein